MRIDELEAREDLAHVMLETLKAVMGHRVGHPLLLSEGPMDNGQRWCRQSLLSIYFSPPLSRRARRFIADSFRHTSVSSRRIAQWVMGTALSSTMGLRWTAEEAFWMQPPVDTKDLVVVPGNRRIRMFDFGTKTAVAWAKNEFDLDGMRREIAIRTVGENGPFPSIWKADSQGRWFVEPLINGRPLSRYSRSKLRREKERVALKVLDGWLNKYRRNVSVHKHVQLVHNRLTGAVADLEQRYGGHVIVSQHLLDELAEKAMLLKEVEVSRSHGDFQPGNILVEYGTGRVFLIDWEFSKDRARTYDLMVYGLKARSPSGLGERLLGYELHGELSLPSGVMPAESYSLRRRAIAALFALEDLDRAIAESLSGPFKEPPPSLLALIKEILHFTHNRRPKQSDAVRICC